MSTATHTAGRSLMRVDDLIALTDEDSYGKHSRANATLSVHVLFERLGHFAHVELPTDQLPAVREFSSPWQPDPRFADHPPRLFRVRLAIWLAVLAVAAAVVVGAVLTRVAQTPVVMDSPSVGETLVRAPWTLPAFSVRAVK